MTEDGTNPVNAEQPLPSEPAQPVSSVTAPTETSAEDTQTPQMGRSEPLGESEPPQATNAPMPPQPAQVFTGKDILVKARATIQDRKRKKFEKILQYLSARIKITNDEVEKLLHVSDATATRYLSQLEREGKIKQVGKTGKAVTYINS